MRRTYCSISPKRRICGLLIMNVIWGKGENEVCRERLVLKMGGDFYGGGRVPRVTTSTLEDCVDKLRENQWTILLASL
jgi:hypothetical protein